MADDKKITQLPAAGALTGTEIVELVQGGVNKQSTTQDIADLGGGGGAWGDITGNIQDQTDLITLIAPIRREVTGTDSIVQADASGLIKFNSATPFNFTLDQLTDESAVQFVNYGAGAVTFVNGSGVTAAGNLVLPAAVGTNYPMAVVIYDSPTTPRVVNGLVIGSNLTTIEALVPAEGSFMQYKSGAWADRTPDQVRADLGYAIALSIHQSTSGLTLTDAPSAERILGGVTSPHRVRVDAASYQFAKLNTDVNTGSASANSPRVYIKYTTDLTGATGWTTVGTGVGAEVISLTSTGLKTTNWITLPGAARSDVLLAVYDAGGDGVADPIVNNVRIFLK